MYLFSEKRALFGRGMTVSSLACTFSGVKKDEFGTPKTLREESQKEFKKETRRVAIKGFDSGTNKQQIEALLSSYHTETIHTDKSGESCKVFLPKNSYI